MNEVELRRVVGNVLACTFVEMEQLIEPVTLAFVVYTGLL